MAIPVIQLPLDPSLANNPNASGMTEYLITGTTYVSDSIAQIVYIFYNSTLYNTDGSYAQFQAFLVANPPTPLASLPTGLTSNVPIPMTLPTPPAPVVSLAGLSNQTEIIGLLRSMNQAMISLATQGGLAISADFEPENFEGQHTGYTN